VKKTLLALAIYTLCSCQNVEPVYHTIQGSTMGTSYNIILEASNPELLKEEIDQLLKEVNAVLSTYESEATISLFNKRYSEYLSLDSGKDNKYFIDNYDLSARIHRASGGAFDPTVMPIVNYWGFGYNEKKKVSRVDTAKVQALMEHVGFEKVVKSGSKITKQDTLLELDYSGIAKGYGVDQVVLLLEGKNIRNFYVEIGGELYAKGLNPKGQIWRTGISVPKAGSSFDEFQQIIEISNKGIATSGNYRNFYESNGQIFSHTINPFTGFPERSNLLSATIIADNCALADGYATACMVLGLDKSIEMINLQEEIEGILVYVDDEGTFQVYDSTKKTK
jgi:thiamine biosynthesis lipoprotein